MVRFEIDTQAEMQDYYVNNEWKDYCFGEGFDDYFVIVSNKRRFDPKKAEAKWFTDAYYILCDIDMDQYPGQVFEFYPDLTREQRKAIAKAYGDCCYIDDLETIVAVANILCPDREFDVAEIRGCSQGDWAQIAYDTKYEKCLKAIEAWCFGMVSEIHMIDGDDDGYIPVIDDDLWEAKQNNLKEWLLDLFGYPKETECEIYKSDGYITTTRWKKVV